MMMNTEAKIMKTTFKTSMKMGALTNRSMSRRRIEDLYVELEKSNLFSRLDREDPVNREGTIHKKDSQGCIPFDSKRGDTGVIYVYPERYEMVLQGEKENIEVDEMGVNPKEVVEFIKNLDDEWYQDNDPDYGIKI